MSQPQVFGFLPTLWFWNDAERHRLVLPIVGMVAVPVTPLLYLLMTQLQLPEWAYFLGITLYPYLIMGLVERYIRKEIHRRAAEPESASFVVSPAAVPQVAPTPWPRAVLATLAVVSLILTIVAVFEVGRAVLLGALILGVTVSLAAVLLPRTRRVARQIGEAEGRSHALP